MRRNNLNFIIPLLCFVIILSSMTVFADVDKTSYDVNSETYSKIASFEIRSNRHTKVTDGAKVENTLNLNDFEKMLENKSMEIWFNSDSDSIRLVDKSNGYIWGCVSAGDGIELNTGWDNFASSICTIEYFNANGSESRLSISDRNVKTMYDWTDTGFTCTFNATRAGILFRFSATLNDTSLTFAVEKDSLNESGNAKLKSLYFMPFLGNSYQDEINGYMFIPDGCGALVRFSKSSSYITGFNSRVYGLDGSIDSLAPAGALQANRINEYLVEENKVTMPVFGIAHGNDQNAFLGVIDGGCEYASIEASPAGVVTGYNWITARFDYRQMYNKTVSSSGIPVVQSEANEMTPSVTYYFLNGQNADYSGMANLYRSLLLNDGIISEERKDSDIPLRIEIVGATVKKGFLFNKVETLTTSDNAISIINKLNNEKINNMTVVYRGWQKGAAEKSEFGKLKAGRNIGGKSGLSDLNDVIKALNSRMYLYTDPVLANSGQIYKSSDAAIGIGDSFISETAANQNQLYPTKYYAKISRICDIVKKGFADYDIAYDNLGNTLYGDYTKNKSYTRTNAIKSITESLSKNAANALYNPNLYCLKYTDDYFDIPVNNSQYQFETDTVPFLQMVLKGSLDYYSTFLNQGYCSQSTILKMIEYGVYPSYIVMYADNYQLSNTALYDYFSLCFEDWEQEILSVYSKINDALSKVEGLSIIEHKVLLEGVVRVTYSDGTCIYVNYLTNDVVVDGITVPAEQYKVCS